MIAGVFLDPDIDESGTELAQAYALWTPVAVTVGLFLAQALRPLGSGLLIAAVAMAGLSYAFWKLDWRGDTAPAATLSG